MGKGLRGKLTSVSVYDEDLLGLGNTRSSLLYRLHCCLQMCAYILWSKVIEPLQFFRTIYVSKSSHSSFDLHLRRTVKFEIKLAENMGEGEI